MRIAVIPAYKPQESFPSFVKALKEEGFEIVVVDDGSGPNFSKTFQSVQYDAHVIQYEENRGKGYALKKAFTYISEQSYEKNTSIVTLDCDGQHLISDAIKVCELAEGNPHAIILGSRKQSKKSPWKSRLGNSLTKFVFFLSTGVKVQDTQTGLRAFNINFLKDILTISGKRYEYEMNMLLHFAKYHIEIIEVPIETIYIDGNKGTHFRPLIDSITIYAEIFKFSASSFIGFLVDFFLYSILVLLFGENSIIIANIIARIVSGSVNFSINYRYVFQTKETLINSALKYSALSVSILLCNSALLYLSTTILGYNPYSAKIAVEVLLFIISWLIQRSFVFVKKEVNMF